MKKLTSYLSKVKDSIVPFMAFLFVYLFDIVYLLRRGRRMLDSDMASEMVLSKLLNTEHSITGLSDSWYYSSELRVFEMQWFYRLGLLLSPHNWLVARTIGMTVALLLFAVGLIILFKDKNGSRKWGYVAAAICLAPGGSWYFWQTIFGGFYLVYILFIVYSLVLIKAFVNNKGKKGKRIASLIGVILLGFASGENGIKQLMVFYAPLVLALVLLSLWDVHSLIREPEEKRKEKLSGIRSFDCLIPAIAGTVFSCIGYLINFLVFAKRYSFHVYNVTLIAPTDLWERFREYLWSFGFNQDIKLISFQGVAAMAGLFVGILTIVSGIWFIINFDKLDEDDRMLTSVFACSVAFGIFIFSYVSFSGIQYYQSFVPEGLCLIVLMIKHFRFAFDKIKTVAVYLLIAIVLFTSAGTVLSETEKPLHWYRAEERMSSYVDYLRSLGYEQGVSTFWKSNLIVELSNGEVEMWTIFNSSECYIHEWLQNKDHKDAMPEGKYFYLLSVTEYPQDQFAAQHPELQMIYADDTYVIFGN
jgi:hypothetical protein